MRAFCLALPALSLLIGCGGGASTFVKSDTALGRVVVYRNGVAYFERSATVSDNTLRLAVPPDKVDDFLKSLTVTDARTGQPAPISYPSAPGEDGTVQMKISLPGSGPHDVRLSYVTEAPAWKPSYRVVLGSGGKVNLQSWAIVDNTSGEDWDRVKLGVGSSSALSFRFNLRSVRMVDRQTLRADDLFAQAPPTGGTTYGPQQAKDGTRVWGDLADDAIVQNEAVAQREELKAKKSYDRDVEYAPAAAPMENSRPSGKGGRGRAAPSVAAAPKAPPPPQQPALNAQQSQFSGMVNGLRNSSQNIVIEGYALPTDADKHAASLDRANKVRDQLMRAGVDANRIAAVGKGEQQGKNGGVRIVEVPAAPPQGAAPGKAAAPEAPISGDPIGTSHFESGSTMSVPKGSAAMVSIYKGDTGGEVVYLYDAESQRGNAQYPFKAVRFKNPTDSQLEQGPVTVFGEGRFIGEGLTEPIPAKSTAFVPFALDRQLVVERKDGERDEIARIITVQRGVFSTEVKHTRKRTLTFHNRGGDVGIVYIRHTPASGYKFTSNVPPMDDKLGGAQLFKIAVPAHGKLETVIEEATPMYKSTDIRTPDGLEMIKLYASEAALDAGLKAKINDLIKQHLEMANTTQRLATVREQQGEYKARMDELHGQIFTLKAVKTAGPMMQSLEKKLMEMSDRMSKTTMEIVALEEKYMLAKIKFQDGVAELTMEPSEKK